MTGTRGWTLWTLIGAAMLAVVLAPALWNGFPFIFPDTGGYLARPLHGTLELGRSALYGTFLLLGVWLDFWPNIVAQAALTVWLIVLTLRTHGLGRNPLLALTTMAGLAVGSAMPWVADTLIPDILLPAAVLSLYLLIFRRDKLRRAERFALMAVVACAIASHMGTLALCFGLLAALALVNWLPTALPRAQLTLAAIATAAGLLLAPVSNLAITGQFALTPGGESFLFGRLVQDGIIARYLDDRCPDTSIRLCAFKDRVPKTADDWLWAPGNPVGELGGWRAYRPEARRIIVDTLRMYPGMHLLTALRSTGEQLSLMKTEVSTVPDWIAPAVESLDELAPYLMTRLKGSRQLAAPAQVDAVLKALDGLQVALAVVSLIALAGIIVMAARLRIPPPAVALAAVVLIAVLGNAAICGIFSNPVDRYQSRLVWLAPLALAVALLSRKRTSTL